MSRAFSLALLLLASGAVAAASAQTCTTSWTAASGVWSDDANWSAGAPEASDTACIARNGTYIVTLDRDQNLAGLVVGGASGTQTLEMNGTFTTLGSGTIRPNGRVENRSGGGFSAVTGTLTLEGVLVHRTFASLLIGGGTLDVAPGGLLLVDAAGTGARIGQLNTPSTLRVRGRMEVTPSATPQNTTIDATIEVIGGTIDVNEGRVDVRTEGLLRDATLDVAEGTLLWFYGTGTSRVYLAEGTISGDVQGVLQFSGSELRAGASGVTLNVGGNGLLGSSGSGIGTAFTYSSAGGEFVNTGLLLVTINGATLRAATIRNRGTLRVDGPILNLAESAEIINEAEGVLDLVDGGQVRGGAEGGRLVSTGRIQVRAEDRASARSRIGVPADLDGATVEITTERLDLNGGSLRDVTFEVPEGSEVLLTSSLGDGVFTTEGTLSGNVGGSIRLTRGEFASGPAGTVLAFSGAGLAVESGSGGFAFLSSAGGGFVNTETVEARFGTTFRGGTFRNENLLRVLGVVFLSENGVVQNVETVDLVTSGSFRGDGDAPGTFVNEALVTKTGGGSSDFRNTLRGQPGSELRVLDGRFSFRDEDPANFGAGVLLTGAGENASFVSSTAPLQGTLSPGTPSQPIATLASSLALRFDSELGDARLVIDVGPNGASDVILSGGTDVLGGTLVVRLQPGYTPAFGDAWTILNNDQNRLPQGAFEAIEVEGAPEGVSFVTDIMQGAVVLRASAAVNVSVSQTSVPEGEAASFVLTHPPSGEAFSIAFETGGPARLFEDYTLSATRGIVRAQPNTTQTVVTLYALRDPFSESSEVVVFRVLSGGDASPGTSPEAGLSISDRPSNSLFAVDAIVPARGSNVGTATATVFGSGFTGPAQIRLEGPATITGQNVTVDPSRAGAQATFDLAGAPEGSYDVVVERGSGSTQTLAGGFTVGGGEGGAPVWASIAGTSAPRFGRWSTYTFTVGNDGDSDIYDTFVLLRLTDGLQYEISGVQLPENPVEGSEEYVGIDVGEVIAVPLYFYHLPARGTRTMTVRIRPSGPVRIGDGAGVSYELYPPNPSALFTYSGDFNDFDLDLAEGRLTNWGVIGGALVNALNDADARGRDLEAAVAGVLNKLPNGPNNPWNRDDGDLTISELQDLYGGLGAFNQYRDEVALNNFNPWGEFVAWGLGTFVVGAAVVAGGVAVGTAAIVGGGVLAISSIVIAGNSAERIRCSRSRNPNCASPPGGAGGGSTGGAGNGPGAGIGGSAGGKVGGPHDPNDKYGPYGEGGQRFYDPALVTTPYTIAFENIQTATFPAQEVIVVDTLDTDVFDLSTFSLGPIRWGNGYSVTPPPGVKAYQTVVDLAPEIPATLLITASLDEATGRAVWRFATLDPNTGDLPEDGTIGFLAPNVTQPEGEGTVSFTIRTREGLPTGTLVENGAEIVFDVNAPIVTPFWSNTVDITAPVSNVQPLAGAESNPITITATGSDAGSGITVYSLYASRDGGPFEQVAQSQDGAFEFTGEEGSTYGFYSLAMDFVSNVEGFKTEAEATTMVAVDAEGAPTGPLALTLEAPRPNPARGLVRLRYGVPNATAVHVRVLDALGREVVVLASGEAPAGWHTAEWSPSVAAGVYVVEIRAGDEIQHQRLTVVR